MLWVFLSVRCSDSLAGDAMGGRSMQDKRIPTVHCSRPAKSSSQDGRELKASLYDNHPWYYSHYDDGDLQMSLCMCVRVCACACTHVCVWAHVHLWAPLPSCVRYNSGHSGVDRPPQQRIKLGDQRWINSAKHLLSSLCLVEHIYRGVKAEKKEKKSE